MQLSDFDFHLPDSQIAQSPPETRGASRLLVVPPGDAPVQHRAFDAITDELRPGDLLVANDARVIPARLIGKKTDTGGRVEILLVRPRGSSTPGAVLEARETRTEWFCLGQASKGLKPGAALTFAAGLTGTVLEAHGQGEYVVALETVGEGLSKALREAGQLPLPPYITRPPSEADEERYQTVYARASGSVAAPTAGLHFTPALLAALEAKGVRRAMVTLDVGPGTFLPVRGDDLDAHVMHEERYVVPPETFAAIAETRAEGGRVVAVGTTVVRTLESATDPETGRLREGEGASRLFIKPGFEFRQVDALITNFHLPRSTLLMLVSAFIGRERALSVYETAVREGYRFFSYGDAMFCSNAQGVRR